MELWIKPEQCTGCAACVNICPKNAIQLVCDEKGYSHPVIDKDSCVDCGLCRGVCAVRKCLEEEAFVAAPKRKEPEIYAAWSRTYATRYNSTSGGVFSELAKVALKEGYYISGAVYDENQMVCHMVGNTEEVLDRIRQSKYTQSDINLVFREIRNLLKQGEKVLFCGAPCQVMGLYEYLGEEPENLITVDFICRGVNSPLAYRAWLDDLETEYGAKAKRVWFKNKELGWNKFSTRVDFEDGRTYRKSRYEDLFMRGYLEKNLFIRPSCTDCRFKGMPRPADITLADFWKIDKSLDADLGTSMAVINSEKGEKLFKKAQTQLVTYKRTYEEALEGNACLVSSPNKGKSSDAFFELLQEGKSYSQAFRIATGETQPLVSVIVAVDRESACLGEAIASICEQEYDNLEILLICGSADVNLREFVKNAAEKNDRVQLLQATEDLASAQNDALACAKGEYVHFCSGGEVLYDGFYASLVEKMQEKHAGAVCCGWADVKNVSMCRNAYSGIGNMRAFIELALTKPDAETDYSGYGSQLWNKLFRRDVLFVDDAPIPFSSQGYGLTTLFWLIQVAFCCNNVLFDSTEMLRHELTEPLPEAVPTFAVNDFFEQETEVLQMLDGVEEYAYDALVRICFEYEIGLLVSAKARSLPNMVEKLYEHVVEFLEVPIDNWEAADAYAQVLELKKDRKFLKTKVNKLEKDCDFLKTKRADLEAELAQYKRSIAARVEVNFRRLLGKILRKAKNIVKKCFGR